MSPLDGQAQDAAESPAAESTVQDAAESPVQDASESPASDTIVKATSIFRKYLGKWTRQRVPKGIYRALENAALDPTSTGGIFLTKGGLGAWVAYFLATTGEGHFSGRLVQTQTMEAFQSLPVEDQVMVAQRIGDTNIHPGAQDTIDKLSDPKRLADAHVVQEAQDAIARLPKRQRIATSDLESHDRTSTFLTGSAPDIHLPDTTSLNTSSAVAQQYFFEHASPSAASDLFPPFLSGAVRKYEVNIHGGPRKRAAVTMTFPNNPIWNNDCCMTLDILKNKVARCAEVLYGVHVESDDHTRYLVLPSGVEVVCSRETTLRICQAEAIPVMFGNEIDRAVTGSQFRYQEEEEGSRRVTRCVTMSFSHDPGEGALLTLNLGLSGGSQIKDKLYQ